VAARHGWNVVAVFTDAGISGTKGRDKRPGYDRLCRGIARREFDQVSAWSVDRLGRSREKARDQPETITRRSVSKSAVQFCLRSRTRLKIFLKLRERFLALAFGGMNTREELTMADAQECRRQAAECRRHAAECSRLSQTDVAPVLRGNYAEHGEELDGSRKPDGPPGRARSGKCRPSGAGAVGRRARAISRRESLHFDWNSSPSIAHRGGRASPASKAGMREDANAAPGSSFLRRSRAFPEPTAYRRIEAPCPTQFPLR
jgi:hypothetical protein